MGFPDFSHQQYVFASRIKPLLVIKLNLFANLACSIQMIFPTDRPLLCLLTKIENLPCFRSIPTVYPPVKQTQHMELPHVYTVGIHLYLYIRYHTFYIDIKYTNDGCPPCFSSNYIVMFTGVYQDIQLYIRTSIIFGSRSWCRPSQSQPQHPSCVSSAPGTFLQTPQIMSKCRWKLRWQYKK